MQRTNSPSLLAGALAFALASPTPAQNPPCFDINIGTDLLLGDDDTAQGLALGFPFVFAGVTYTDVCVCSNGYVWFGATSVAGGDYSPSETSLVTDAPRVCPLWNDFNPSDPASGHVFFNAVPASGSVPAHAVVTWANVFEYGTSNAVSMQIVLDANNAMRVIYGANTPMGGVLNPDILIGASPGNNIAANPVSFATLPLTIAQANFDEVVPSAAFPYTGTSMLWTSTGTGYVATSYACSPNNLPGPAGYTTFGQGCPLPPVLYETFDQTSTIDLSNLSFSFLPTGTGGGFVMLQLPSPLFTGLTNNLGAGDDTTHSVTLPFPFPFMGNVLTSIVVSSNGFLYLSANDGGNGCCNGDVFDFLNNEPRIAGHCMDLYPPGGNGVFADLDPVTGDFCITWDAVPEYSAGPANTFQIALKPTGAFDIRYGSVANTGHFSLCGFSAGLGATDPGITDLSATTVQTFGGGRPLALTNVNASLPQLGGTLVQEVSAIPTTSNIAVLLIGLVPANPPMDLGFLGAPGCTSYVNFLTGPTATMLAVTLGAASHQYSLTFPTSPAFNGVQMFCQGAADNPGGNQLGVMLSNAAQLTLGY